MAFLLLLVLAAVLEGVASLAPLQNSAFLDIQRNADEALTLVQTKTDDGEALTLVQTKTDDGATHLFFGLLLLTASCAACSTYQMYETVAEHRDQELIFDESRSQLAQARVTEKATYTEQSGENTKTYFTISYEFDFERRYDGRRCQVVVSRRHIPKDLWDKFSQGRVESVRYLEDDPKHCRLESDMQYEDYHGPPCCARTCGSLFCILLGCYLAYLLISSAHAKGKLKGFTPIVVAVWLLVACGCTGCFFSDGKRSGPIGTHPTEGSSLRELEWGPASGDLGDLSGDWLVESDIGNFEYKFSMGGATANVVDVRGKAVGDSDFQPLCHGHFFKTEGKELLRWQDSDGTVFTIDFSVDGLNAHQASMTKFKGSARALDGQQLDFTGQRQ